MPRRAARSPYHDAKTLPTLLLPSDDFSQGDMAVQGWSTESCSGWGGRARAGRRQQAGGEARVMSQAGKGHARGLVLIMGSRAKSGFLGWALCQGLAIPARWCHLSTGLLPALGQPSRVEEEKREEGATWHPVSLWPSLQGCLGTPGPAAEGRIVDHSPRTGAAAPWSLCSRLLKVTQMRTTHFPTVMNKLY